MAKVEVYTKMFCPYCTRAKSLLAQKGAAFEDYDITMGGPKRAETAAGSIVRRRYIARASSQPATIASTETASAG